MCIVIVVLVLAGIVITIDLSYVHARRMRAAKIESGFTKQQVGSILGKPVTVFMPPAQPPTNFIAALLTVQCETWAYGSRLEFREAFVPEFPFVFPFRLRLFRPASDDVAIEFDSAGLVKKVYIPE